MKKYALLFVGVALLSSAVGCYCGHGGCYTPNYLSPGVGFGGGCPGGDCGVAPGGYVPGGYVQPAYPQGIAPQGMLYQDFNSAQAGYPGSFPAPLAYGGGFAQPFGIPQTAAAPLEPLPTY